MTQRHDFWWLLSCSTTDPLLPFATDVLTVETGLGDKVCVYDT